MDSVSKASQGKPGPLLTETQAHLTKEKETVNVMAIGMFLDIEGVKGESRDKTTPNQSTCSPEPGG